MALMLGIDLGTSSLKILVVNERGNVVATYAKDYQFTSPLPGLAEQDPEVWWEACKWTIREVISLFEVNQSEIAAIGLSGQMHGLVTIDNDLNPVRKAILHCDARTERQVDEILSTIENEEGLGKFLNPIYTGFMLPSLMWIKNKEPESFDRIYKVILPKDYLRLKLTGTVGTDYTDASGTLAFDQIAYSWNYDILDELGIPRDFFPECSDSTKVIGRITESASTQTGLPVGIPIVAGGSDQVMQSIGNGVVGLDTATVNIGTSGQVCYQSNNPVNGSKMNANTFIGYKHGRWITIGATMSAGLSMRWFKENFLEDDYVDMNNEIDKIVPGSEGLLFLPFLNGERTPHFNSKLRAVFMGMSTRTTRYHMARSVMEGVAFSLKECVDICNSMGLEADKYIASGGGAKSEPWMQLLSDILNKQLLIAEVDEQACLGAAIIAAVGIGIYSDLESACKNMVTYKDKIFIPSKLRHKQYMKYFQLYKEAYRSSVSVIEKLTSAGRESVNSEIDNNYERIGVQK